MQESKETCEIKRKRKRKDIPLSKAQIVSILRQVRKLISRRFLMDRSKFSFLTALFQTPVVPTTAACKAPTGIGGFPCVSPRPQVQNLQGFATTTQTPTPTPYVSSHVSLTPLPCRSTSPIVSVTSVTAPVASTTFRQSPSPNTPLPYATSHSPGVLQVYLSIDRHREGKRWPR